MIASVQKQYELNKDHVMSCCNYSTGVMILILITLNEYLESFYFMLLPYSEMVDIDNGSARRVWLRTPVTRTSTKSPA